MTAEAVILLVPALLAAFAAGVLVGHVATRWGLDRDRERVEVRKDSAVEAAMATAFELQRVAGEHPVAMYAQTDEETLPADGRTYGLRL